MAYEPQQFHLSDTAKRWLIFGGIACVGLVIAIIAIASTSASPRSYIRDHYRCSPDPTSYDSSSCTSTASPTSVARAIANDTRPVDRGSRDGMEFLQYNDDIVVVKPYGSGSRITVDDYTTGYHHYSSYFGYFGWTSYRPGGGSHGGYGGGGWGGGGK